jgi:hypothetical protein
VLIDGSSSEGTSTTTFSEANTAAFALAVLRGAEDLEAPSWDVAAVWVEVACVDGGWVTVALMMDAYRAMARASRGEEAVVVM